MFKQNVIQIKPQIHYSLCYLNRLYLPFPSILCQKTVPKKRSMSDKGTERQKYHTTFEKSWMYSSWHINCSQLPNQPTVPFVPVLVCTEPRLKGLWICLFWLLCPVSGQVKLSFIGVAGLYLLVWVFFSCTIFNEYYSQ